MSRREAAASYRLNADYCFEAARVTEQPGRRLALLNMAQAWTELADVKQKSGGDLGEDDLQKARAAIKRSARRRG